MDGERGALANRAMMQLATKAVSPFGVNLGLAVFMRTQSDFRPATIGTAFVAPALRRLRPAGEILQSGNGHSPHGPAVAFLLAWGE